MNNYILTQDKIDQITNIAEAITETTCRISKDKINLSDGSHSANNAWKDLKSANINLKPTSKLLNLSAGNAGADSSGGVGATTLEIFNELVQDVSPENGVLERSPFNEMLPFKTVTAVTAQQDKYEAMYGWARPANGVLGALNPVPLLESSGQTYTGYLYNAKSWIEGFELIKWREMGSSNISNSGLMQKMAIQQLLLVEQVKTIVELIRIESLVKGSFAYNDIAVGTGIPATNVYTASQSLGTYTTATNKLSVNALMTNNLLKEIGMMLVAIQNMGIEIEAFVVPNTIYLALFQSPPIDARTVYMSAVSGNNVGEMRNKLFQNTNIPTLAGVNIISDNRAIKTTPGETSTLNTRPIMYGETIDSASFRGIVLTKPTSGGVGVAKTGNLGFFPNVYNRGGSPIGGSISSSGFDGNISLITQDLSMANSENQRVQMIATTCVSPMIMLQNTIFVFDFNVNIV